MRNIKHLCKILFLFGIVICFVSPVLTKGAPQMQASNMPVESKGTYETITPSAPDSGTPQQPSDSTYVPLPLVEATSDEPRYLLTLNIYSGRENPTYSLTKSQIDKLKGILSTTVRNIPKAPPALGYRGFVVISQDQRESFTVLGNPNAESYLTNLIQRTIPKSVTYQVRQEIPKIRIANTLVQSALAISAASAAADRCNYTPIRGTDFTPVYNPSTNNFGCYLTRQANNNCYNYSTDVITNTFAQPGRATGNFYTGLTCDAVKAAAKSDGLIWLGTRYPNYKFAYGHFVALVIWESNDFHWLRRDTNGYWSHKPGTSHVINYDVNFNLITNPAVQNLSPYTFCGYLWLRPSNINIS